MPRVTRAALRSKAVFEDEPDLPILAASIPLPSTPQNEREPLANVSINQVDQPMGITADEAINEKDKKTRAGKAKKTKKGKKQPKIEAEETVAEVLEDCNHSESSSAVEEACNILLKENTSEVVIDTPMSDERPTPSQTPIIDIARRIMTPKALTPRFNPEVHKSNLEDNEKAPDNQEDSFIGAIGSRTPAMITNNEPLDAIRQDQIANKSLNIENFVSTDTQSLSPPRTASMARIEDSVEAIDALEDALQEVGESLPTMIDENFKQAKVKKGTRVISNPAGTKTKAVAGRQSTVSRKDSSGNSKSKPTLTVRQSDISSSRPKKATLQPSMKSSAPTLTKKENQPLCSSSAANARATTTKRPILSVQKAPFQPAKSTKAPTRPNFELPGEAISRKLKEQREERLKREEEEKSKKREFKARPVRLSQAPAVKPTAASKARMSITHHDSIFNDNAPKDKPLATASASTAAKRKSSLRVAKRPSSNMKSSPPLRRASHIVIPSSRKSSANFPSRSTLTAAEAAQQKVRGKEIFGRDRQEMDERERARKEKEEAARKARAEAAERGRKASREWAERMRAKKNSVQRGEMDGQAGERKISAVC